MIETAGDQAVADDRWGGFETVFSFVSPDQATVFFVETIKTSVSGAEVDAGFVDGWLAGPARAAPRIFVQASLDPVSFEFPDDF